MKTHTIRKILAHWVVLVLFLCACISVQARDFVVVIDPGHGGKDVGCAGNYSYEKDIVLAVGKMLGDNIKRNYNNVQVIYTRDTDRFIPLQDRADKANRNHADLFISIHVNSVAEKTKNRKTIQGTSVYTLGAERTAANLEVAKRENSVIILEEDYTTKYGGYDPDNPESDIMMGLLQNRYINESIDFATLAQNQLVKTAGRADHEVKQAGFLVLRNVSAPSVLVELDFICNPTQEKFLSSKAGQEKMALALYNAFRSYMTTKMRQASIGIEEQPAQNNQNANSNSDSSKDDNKGKDNKKDNKKDSKKDKDKDKKDQDKKDQDKKDKDQDRKDKPQNGSSAPAQSSQTPAQQQPSGEQPAQQPSDQQSSDQQPAQQQPTSPTEHVQQQFQTNIPMEEPRPGVIQYKVQIFTSNKVLKPGAPEFKGIKNVDYYKDGVYKYTVGLTSSMAEAEKLLQWVKTKFRDAFIIQWKDGQRVK